MTSEELSRFFEHQAAIISASVSLKNQLKLLILDDLLVMIRKELSLMNVDYVLDASPALTRSLTMNEISQLEFSLYLGEW